MRQLHFVLIFMLLLFAGIPAAFAQKRTISGKISETTDGRLLPFVNVTVKGTSVGTTTNADGLFSIDVPDGSNTLVFSYVGYATQEKALDGSTASVMLEASNNTLDEVVVSGLATP